MTENFPARRTLSEEERMKKMMIKGLAVVGFILFLVTPVQATPEYLYLTANGNEMAPTICNGDTARVQVCSNVSLINPGSQTNLDSGDIIVYCDAVTGSQPRAMWTCGRVISKYFKDGHWYFKTKLDNRTEPDPWEVPDYSLLGVVVDVIPNGNNLDKGSARATNSQREQPTSKADPRFGLPEFPTLVFDFNVGIALGLILGLTIKKVLPKRAFGSTSQRYSIQDSCSVRDSFFYSLRMRGAI